MGAQEIAEEARNKIGSFCINTCRAKCCKRGYIPLNDEEQVEVIVGSKKEELLKLNVLIKKKNGLYVIDAGKQPCPSLNKENKCNVYTNSLRPKSCSEYPIFLHGEYVFFADDCDAVKEGLLNDAMTKFKDIGIKVI